MELGRFSRIASNCLIFFLTLTASCSRLGAWKQKPFTPSFSVEDEQFRRSIGSLMGVAIVRGNKIEELKNGDEIFPAMLEAIKGAQKSINFETYVFWSGKLADQ